MPLCKSRMFVKGRIEAHAQTCGALAEEGIDYCAAHAKPFRYRRCPTCRKWLKLQTASPRVENGVAVGSHSQWFCVDCNQKVEEQA